LNVEIRDTFITMAQFLKKANLVSSGGETKHFLATVEITVNGVSEQRRGKKLVPGDVIRIQDQEFTIQGPTV